LQQYVTEPTPDINGYDCDRQSSRHAAGLVAAFVYIIGVIASFWLPEPKGEMED
jgi:hypothetical protein